MEFPVRNPNTVHNLSNEILMKQVKFCTLKKMVFQNQNLLEIKTLMAASVVLRFQGKKQVDDFFWVKFFKCNNLLIEDSMEDI